MLRMAPGEYDLSSLHLIRTAIVSPEEIISNAPIVMLVVSAGRLGATFTRSLPAPVGTDGSPIEHTCG